MGAPRGVELRVETEGAGRLCAEILAALPEWFGFPDSVAAYVAAADTNPTVVAALDGRDSGILTLELHSPYAAEIVVMGVLPSHHRAGIGRSLLEHAESWLAARSVECRSRRSARATATRGTPPRGPSTSPAASGPSRSSPSCGARTSRRYR
jgi:GNAT superfamily N-acetyltransferase